MMGNMHDVGASLPESERKREVIAPGSGAIGLRELCKVRAQWPELKEVPIGAHEKVLVLIVHLRQVTHEVPDVGSDPELVDSSDIDCDAHGATGVIIMKRC